ncbi:MAG: hypothetical protein ABJN57_13680 [Hyphomicrobiales bacterium]
MDKGIECGIRITRKFFELTDEDFEKRLPGLTNRFSNMLHDQRRRFTSITAVANSKTVIDTWTNKGFELYCKIEKGNDADNADKKGWARALGLIASRVECGVRMKEHTFEMPDTIFKSYVSSASETFTEAVRQQRAAYLELEKQEKAFGDSTSSSKDVELYCEWKNFCG